MLSFFKTVPSITTQDLESLIDNQINLIDVRSPGEYKSGHIRQAKNIPLQTINNYKTDKKTYVICQSGMRSKRAAKILKSNGVDVVNVKGGMSAWTGKKILGK